MHDCPHAHEPRSIAAAMRHRRLGVASAEAMVVLALALSIFALLTAIGIDVADAGAEHHIAERALAR